METIFDYNPTKEEMERLGISYRYEILEKQIARRLAAYNKYNDDRLWDLGMLFCMRNQKEKGYSYFNNIEQKSRLNTLIEDF